ncbi:PaaI family thioesterase [Erysipelothrix urinaevulpis]|uniref:PaaI family thioesterase n=1 Tax=Erysipelothrix urinaevulpis TaxID=2683717 RepID=UPI00135A02A1|nr:PaaI family thioesterase [Erysipelothrix urinaevulpis]
MDYMKHLGMSVVEAKEGYAHLEMEITPTSLNYFGYVHGGVYFSLSDTTAGYATHAYEGSYITLNSSINYLKGIQEGVLSAKATVLNKTRKTVVIDVKTYSNEILCTQATITMYRVA